MRVAFFVPMTLSVLCLTGCGLGSDSEMDLLAGDGALAQGDAEPTPPDAAASDGLAGDDHVDGTDAHDATVEQGGGDAPVDLCLNSQCAAPTPVCDPASGVCVECLSSAACGGDQLYCAPGLHVCVECLGPANCTAEGRTCDSLTYTCAEACAGDGDCTTAEAPRCNLSRGTCVQCLGESDCNVTDPLHCLLPAGACVECTDDSHCDSGNCDPVDFECVD